MYNSIGERGESRKRKVKQIIIALMILIALGGLLVYIFDKDPEKTQKPTDIVMGTGGDLQLAYLGPPELEVTWDLVEGHPWSISLVEGRIRNISTSAVKFRYIFYGLLDENGEVIWQEADQRFLDGGTLQSKGGYLCFHVNPITRRGAHTFQIYIEEPEILN